MFLIQRLQKYGDKKIEVFEEYLEKGESHVQENMWQNS